MSNGIIGGIIFLVILTIAVIVGLKKSADKKAMEKFIDGIGDNILEVVLTTINKANPTEFNNLNEFKNLVIRNTYSAVWDYVAKTAEEAVEVDQITKSVFKLIDKDTVVNFINSLEIDEFIEKAFKKGKKTEEIDLDEDYSDQSQYIEDASDFELPAAEEEVPTEKELAKIIPPTEEEEDDNLDLEDDSVEIVTDSKEIIKTVSKTGQDLYYEIDESGKKTRVSKDYALEHMES